MKLQKLLSLTRKAVDEFQLIEPGDKIAVGVSGGKDSLTMLYALHGLMRFYPNPFTLEAITVDSFYSRKNRYCTNYFRREKRKQSLFTLCKNEKRCSQYRCQRLRMQ